MNQPRFKIKQVEEALRKSAGIISAAAKILEAAGGSCTPQTVRNYIKRHPSLQTVIEETVELNLDLAESNLIAKIGNKNMTAIIFYLKTKGKHRGFVERNPRDRAARLSEGPHYPSQVPRCTTSCRNTSRSCPWHLGPTGAEIGQPVVPAVPHHDVGVFRPVPDALVEHRRDDAVRRPLQQLPGEAAANAVAHVEEFADPEMVHQPKLVVGKGVPPVVDRHRSGRLAAIGVTLVHRDAAEVVLEFFHRVDCGGRPVADARIEPAAGSDQQREAPADLLVADADVSFLIERHGSL